MRADAVTLSFPRAKPFHGVARLVVGGLAARLDLPYEQLEDLQLALVSVLEHGAGAAGEDVTVRLLVGPESIGMVIGPLDGGELHGALAAESDEGISLSRLLSTLVTDVSVEEADGGHWLRLEKRAPVTLPRPREEA